MSRRRGGRERPQPLEILRLDAANAGFEAALARLLDRVPQASAEVAAGAAQIVDDVRARGDAALLEHTARLDALAVKSARDLEIVGESLGGAWRSLASALRVTLEATVARLRAYAEKQKLADFEFADEHGNKLGQRVTALDRVGIYVPGGKAAYP